MNKKTTKTTAATKTAKAATGASRSSATRAMKRLAWAQERLERFYRQAGNHLGEEPEEEAYAQAAYDMKLCDELYLEVLDLDALPGTAKAGRSGIHAKRVQVVNRTYWRDGSGKRLVSEETRHEYRRSSSTGR